MDWVTIVPSVISLAVVILLFWFLLPFRDEIRQAIGTMEAGSLRIGDLLEFTIRTRSPSPTEGGVDLITRNDSIDPETGEPEVETQPKAILQLDEEADDQYPADYLFLTHTSFLRPEKQTEFTQTTGLTGLAHFDIRVILNSYYEGALDSVERVTYFLHKAYDAFPGGAVRVHTNREEKFLLKEVANGEYVLLAEVKLKGKPLPITLQRYITLWKSGPKIERYL